MFIRVDEENNVYHRCCNYDSLTPAEKEKLGQGFIVDDDFPESAPQQVGKDGSVKYINGAVSFEYKDRPLTPEEKIVQLESTLMETTMLLAGEQEKNQQNEQAILELSMLVGGVA